MYIYIYLALDVVSEQNSGISRCMCCFVLQCVLQCIAVRVAGGTHLRSLSTHSRRNTPAFLGSLTHADI